jgi:hypothetical protein
MNLQEAGENPYHDHEQPEEPEPMYSIIKGFVDWFNKTDKTQGIIEKRIEQYLETKKPKI